MKAKSILAALLLMVAGIQTAAAQGFRVYKSDGTVAQFSFRTDSIVFYDGIGTDADFGPFTPVNQCLVGTWYKTKSEAFTFNEDGTTDYLDGATYEFLPYQGTLIINNAEGKLTKLLRVPKVTKDYIVLSEWGGETFAVLTSAQPVQLVTGNTVSPASLTLDVNETATLAATVKPADADNKEVEWASSDEAVAVVGDFFGIITVMAKGYGSCTITATAKDGSGVKGECQVKVAKLATGITLSQTSLTLEVGKTQTLTASIQPSDATDKSVAWKSSDTSVAAVSASGKVTAKAAGTCTITATAKDGSGLKATCQLTVVQPVTGITLSHTSLSLEVGKTQTLTATIQPADATDKSVTWTSSNTSVATVSTSGKVTAKAVGTCTVTCAAKDGSGIKAECKVTVKQTGINGHAFVEIGGLKWATMNVGATTVAGSYETCYGDYYAWSETEPRYKTITRVGADAAVFTWKNGYTNGYIDNYPTYTSMTLDATHDAATANWGGTWRTPTPDEYRALFIVCLGSSSSNLTPVELTSTITDGGIYWLSSTQTIESAYTGVAGLLFVSKNDISKRVFFPACGSAGTFLQGGGKSSSYWSSSHSSYDSGAAHAMHISSSSVYPSGSGSTNMGYSVRPVSD